MKVKCNPKEEHDKGSLITAVRRIVKKDFMKR